MSIQADGGGVKIGSPLYLGNVNILDVFYPVGSIYMSTKLIDPDKTMGGKWERIRDRFMYAIGNGEPNKQLGNVGGTITLTEEQFPSHYHGIGHKHGLDDYYHTIDHEHPTFTISGGDHEHGFRSYNCTTFSNKPNPGYCLAIGASGKRGSQVVVNGAVANSSSTLIVLLYQNILERLMRLMVRQMELCLLIVELQVKINQLILCHLT